MIEVYGASYFFEGDPETPVIVLWARRGSEEQISEMRIAYVYLGRGYTTWTMLFADMPRPLVDPDDWQYDHYRNKKGFSHVESSEPLRIAEPGDPTAPPPGN